MSAERDRLPSFLIIGAPKSGTTSMVRYLRHHPDVFLPAVEAPKYFAFREAPPRFTSPDAHALPYEVCSRRADYLRLFDGRRGQRASGEKSTVYLWSEAAPGAIREEVPDARLIAIFRNPADRAHSNFTHNRRGLREPLADFGAALEAEPERKRQGWSYNFLYRERGRYAEQVERYLRLFPRDQLLFLLHDDLVADAAAVMRSVCKHLGVSEEHDLHVSERHNVSRGVPRSGLLHRVLTRESRLKSAFRALAPRALQRRAWRAIYDRNQDPLPRFDPVLRRALVAEFAGEVRRLETLIGRDLSPWLEA